jgi:hypothetical protein
MDVPGGAGGAGGASGASLNSRDLFFLSHTPPVATPSSYGQFAAKRGRTGSFGGRARSGSYSAELSSSLSSRLRSASELEQASRVIPATTPQRNMDRAVWKST